MDHKILGTAEEKILILQLHIDIGGMCFAFSSRTPLLWMFIPFFFFHFFFLFHFSTSDPVYAGGLPRG